MAGVYGPDRQPLGHPATTRLINQLWPESEDERRDREQRELHEAIYTDAVRKFFRDTEPLR